MTSKDDKVWLKALERASDELFVAMTECNHYGVKYVFSGDLLTLDQKQKNAVNHYQDAENSYNLAVGDYMKNVGDLPERFRIYQSSYNLSGMIGEKRSKAILFIALFVVAVLGYLVNAA